jgi:hypothetical protein
MVEEIPITSDEIIAGDLLHMSSPSTALKPLRRSASRQPGVLIGSWPLVEFE